MTSMVLGKPTGSLNGTSLAKPETDSNHGRVVGPGVMVGTMDAEVASGHLAGPGLLLQLDLPEQVALGESVSMELLVRNASDQAITLALSGRPPYDFVVTGADGAEVWHSLKGEVVPQILALLPMEPGERVRFTAQWRQQDNAGRAVQPGVYWALARLHAHGSQALEAGPKRIAIGPRAHPSTRDR